MTKPLMPADADLQDFPFMPLHVARLRDSDLAAEGHPEANWYAILLWASAWHQVPAGSLPDNDMVLMRLVDLGRDTATWQLHKADALRGFVKCDDGRLYHPVIAEQAITAWKSKVEQRHRTECARIKKANQRNDTNDPCPDFETYLSLEFPASVPFLSSRQMQLSLGTPPLNGRDIGSKGEGEGQGQREGYKKEEEANASPPSGDGDALKPEHFVEAWNDLAKRLGKPTVRDLTPSRKQALRARINGHSVKDFQDVLANIESSTFLKSERGKFCTFDWVTKSANFQKILEGNYNE